MDFYGLLDQIRLDRQAALDALVDEREHDFKSAVRRLASHAELLRADVEQM